MLEIHAPTLPVKNRAGETLYYVSAAAAHRLIERKRMQPVGTKKVIRALLLDSPDDDSKVTPISAYAGQRYSHSRETDKNPAGVWTHRSPFTRRDRPVFLRVVTDCLRPAA